MNPKFLPVAVAALLIFVSTSSAQLAPPDRERFYKQLKFNTVKCFNEARAQLKTQVAAAEYLKDYLKEKAVRSQVSRELEKIMPEVKETLKANPNECALVSVTIDCSTNVAARQFIVRSLRLEGTGDAAVQSIAHQLFFNSKLGTITNTPAGGFNYDTNLSHLICFGVDKGEIKATSVYFPTVQTALIAAVQVLQNTESTSVRPLPPTNLRIQATP